MDSLDSIKNFVDENRLALLYFGTETCSVCHGLEPQVKRLLEEYPKVKEKFICVNDVN
ncbi:thioredoxin family protein [Peptoniphilus asaccharolyticus]|uniref:thioredoxin family protein n=1 Tax=Peptoniphilus asaccharolyticus TaxID=1258 RepID=UPI0011816DC1|nr:thioredoxin family protein [Peptoniphilus asaccharolyticus]MBL7574281.1 thioredoxin family protein [Peptoniphilus asaccharolyticus]